MTRAILPLLLFVLAALSTGCGSTGVGDPCNPQHPPYTGGASCAPDSGCFVGTEIYIETRSLQCRTRVCMVYQWNEEIMSSERSKRVFCTCRCGGVDQSAGNFCTCDPEHFTCTTAFLAGEPGIRGSYCVRNEIPGIQRDGGPG